MFTDRQLESTPFPVLETAGEHSRILVQLLEEVERDMKKKQQEAARRPARQPTLQPRPFAYD